MLLVFAPTYNFHTHSPIRSLASWRLSHKPPPYIPAMGSGTLVPRQIDICEIGDKIVRASGINSNLPA